MELIKIHEELINEAKGPLQAFEYILKAAGKSLGDANGALLRSIQKINPNVKQLFKATPEEINKAFGRLEFKEYRKILVDFYLTNQKKEIEKILKSFDLSNTQAVKQAKAEIANKLQHKNAIANDIVDRYKPKKVGTTGGKVVPKITNPYDALKPVVISQESKDAFLESMSRKNIKIKPQHLDDVMREVQKSVDIQVGKVEKIFEDPTFVKTLQSFNRLPIEKQDEIVLKAIEIVKKSYGDYLMGLKVSQKTKNNLQSMYDGAVWAFYLGMKKRGEKLSLGQFLSWYFKSIPVTWSIFFGSIYIEAQRLEDGVGNKLGFAWDKLAQSPRRFLISLIPGVNLIVSSSVALYQGIVSGVVVGSKEIKKRLGTDTPKPGESGLFNNSSVPSSNENDPAGIMDNN